MLIEAVCLTFVMLAVTVLVICAMHKKAPRKTPYR